MIKIRFPKKIEDMSRKKPKSPPSTATIMEEGLSDDLQENIARFKKLFDKNDTLIIREVQNRHHPEVKCCLIFFDGMVMGEMINQNIIRPLTLFRFPGQQEQQQGQEPEQKQGQQEKQQGQEQKQGQPDTFEYISTKVIQINELKKTDDLEQILESILYGDTVLLVDGYATSLVLNTKGFLFRSIMSPEAEKTLVGPRESFIEVLMFNLSMIRRRIKNPKLKFEFRTFGSRTHTTACICYVEGIAHKEILEELDHRLESFDMDGILDVEYLRDFICDAPFSLFNTIGSTERPDVVAGKILEGRIAVLVDGTPMVITLPYLFVENIQTDEDYYVTYYMASFNRLLRILSLILTTCIPAIYLALVTFHQELIPTPLLLSVSASRQGVPFPTIVELIGLLLVFEVLRETGIRMPTSIGQAFSIVGALVLGQAAVQAKFVSATIVIIVAIAGITNLMLPKMASTTMVLRLIYVGISMIMGLYGFVFAFAVTLIHMYSLRSFGVPFMAHVGTFKKEDIKDTALRVPWWYMNMRPRFIAAERKRKTKKDSRA